MAAVERPTSVTVISALVIVAGVVALVVLPFLFLSEEGRFALEDAGVSVGPALIESVVAGAITLILGIAILQGRNWGRMVYLWLNPIYSAASWFLYGFYSADIPGVVFYIAALWFLTRPDAAAYFAQRARAPRQAEITSERGQRRETLPGDGTLTQGDGTPGQVRAPEAPQAAWLRFRSGSRAGQTIPIRSASVTIGRAADNDVVVDDATVSRHHARVSFDDGQFYVEDTKSISGTLVEGEPITRDAIAPGNRLRMGQTELVLVQSQGPAATRMPGDSAPASHPPAHTTVIPNEQDIMAWLAVTAGPDKGKSYQLKVGDNTIGRGADNDLVIQDGSVSRSHAMIRVQEDSFVLVDLGSGSGTRAGGRTLEGKPLKTGSVISVGQTQLSLVQTEGHDPVELATMTGQTVVVQPGEASGGVLVVQSGPDAGKSFALAAGDNLIGREPDGKVLLTDGAVSRRHALIRKEQDRFVIFDLGSRSGTRVDGESMGGHRLSAGEVITLGRSELTLMRTGSKEQ